MFTNVDPSPLFSAPAWLLNLYDAHMRRLARHQVEMATRSCHQAVVGELRPEDEKTEPLPVKMNDYEHGNI